MSLYAMYIKRVVTAMEEKESSVIYVATAKVLPPQIAGSGRVRKLSHANHTILWHAYSGQIISTLCSFFRY